MVDRPTGTVTFLFTDIEGSTRLWEEHPAEMQAALERHDTILRSTIEAHRGYVFSTAGDAFCAAFRTPVEAIHAALDAQRSLGDESWAGGVGLRVRMGLHAGTADERDGDYFGAAVFISTGYRLFCDMTLVFSRIKRLDHAQAGSGGEAVRKRGRRHR